LSSLSGSDRDCGFLAGSPQRSLGFGHLTIGGDTGFASSLLGCLSCFLSFRTPLLRDSSLFFCSLLSCVSGSNIRGSLSDPRLHGGLVLILGEGIRRSIEQPGLSLRG
jgi:hypothetical protein